MADQALQLRLRGGRIENAVELDASRRRSASDDAALADRRRDQVRRVAVARRVPGELGRLMQLEMWRRVCGRGEDPQALDERCAAAG